MNDARRYFAGIDSGSWNTKAVVVDGDARIVGSGVVRTGADLVGAAERALAAALQDAGLDRSDLATIWSTGFGRHAIPFVDGTRTELDSHARGAMHHHPGPFTVIDIGGQDAKVIRIDANGRRIAHKMNRKCAAGTGAFLEEIALRLGVPIEGLPALEATHTELFEISSFCTVFAGTEVLGYIRQGKRAADLAHAAYRSVVKRVLEMERITGPVVATGGVVGFHPSVVALLEEKLQTTVFVPPQAQGIGALGIALWARSEGDRPVDGTLKDAES